MLCCVRVYIVYLSLSISLRVFTHVCVCVPETVRRERTESTESAAGRTPCMCSMADVLQRMHIVEPIPYETS